MVEEKMLAKQLLSVNFSSNENYMKTKDTLCVTLKELLRGIDYKSVEAYCSDAESTITFIHKEEIQEDELFQMDVTPCPVPIAYVKYEATKSLESPAANENAVSGPKNACFNCGTEGHAIKDCTVPKDAKRISKARQNMSKKNERYHLNPDQRYDAYRPGVISDNLRNALGLKQRELPLHIYHMRVFGYPLGWLEEAKIRNSGLTMFNHHKTEANDDEEEAIYDPNEIVEYPGFNVSVGDEFNDDFRKYNFPKMQLKHEKRYFISNLKTRSNKANVENVDMEVENSDEGEDAEKSSSPPASPSMIDLRNEQQKLLEQLNSEINDEEGENGDLSGFIVLDETQEEETLKTPECSITTRSNTLSAIQGTPILESCSPFSKLPKGDSWSVGVSDVINFENLPDSTGKYEQMKDVLTKVRKCLNK